jgi:predicted nucleotide-binding protein
MARINPDLLDRLKRMLGVGTAQAYARIQKKANADFLDRHLAALALAAEHGINIQKYSTAEERAAIRGARGNERQAPESLPRPTPAGAARSRWKKGKTARRSRAKDNSVFVVHGRNEALRKSMFDFLRALGLNPMEWSKALLEAKGANPHIEAVLEAAMGRVQAVVVLFSPDDEAKLKDEFCTKTERRTEGRLQGQPRPNVIFEAGLALGRHPEKTLLVEVGKVRGFTDIAGRHIVRLSNGFDKRNDIANRLRKIGLNPDTRGTDWTMAGDFSA